MKRFLRPKAAVGDKLESNKIPSVPQPSTSGDCSNTSADETGDSARQPMRSHDMSGTKPCESGARSSTDDRRPSGSVIQPASLDGLPRCEMSEAQRSVTYTDGLDDEIMSCGSDIEVDEFDMPDDSHFAN